MRRLHPTLGLVALVATLCLAGCEMAQSANPAAPSVVGPTPDARVAVDQPDSRRPFAGSNVDGGNPASWSTDEWRTYVLALAAEKGGPTVSDAGMLAMRDDLVARGADFQNGWRGDLRPRLFLPVPECPSPDQRDAPPCSYSRTVDLGHYGQEWQWIQRF